MLGRLRMLVTWSWTYLWAVWFILVGAVIYMLRGPLKLSEHASSGEYCQASALLALLLLRYLKLPWFGGGNGGAHSTSTSLMHGSEPPSDGEESTESSHSSHQSIPECKVWRNPMSLFRGAEYSRLTTATGREPLTYYDMNLSAQDHQNFFTCESDRGKPEYEAMQIGWRERSTEQRVAAAHKVLDLNPDCACAMILLAEEECKTVTEVETLLRKALKVAESLYRKSQQIQHMNSDTESLHRRDTNVLIYIRRRLAMCARRLGRIKEAVKMMRDLVKEFPMLNVMNIHENLIEALLEMQAYADAQAVLARYDDISLPKSATICYTAALLRARVVADKFSPDIASKKGLSAAEMNAVEAIHRAVEFNPHVPKYLLEMKALIFPSEHILKRGDSEAIAYAFWHLQHWKRVEGALSLLQCTWEGTFRMIPYPLVNGHLFYPYSSSTEAADKELLPSWHELSVYPKKELPFVTLFTAGLCSGTAVLAFLTHKYPKPAMQVMRTIVSWISLPVGFMLDRLETLMPSNILQLLASSAKTS